MKSLEYFIDTYAFKGTQAEEQRPENPGIQDDEQSWACAQDWLIGSDYRQGRKRILLPVGYEAQNTCGARPWSRGSRRSFYLYLREYITINN